MAKNGLRVEKLAFIGWTDYQSKTGRKYYNLDFGICDEKYLKYIGYHGKVKPIHIKSTKEWLESHLKDIDLKTFENSVNRYFTGYINRNPKDNSQYLGNIELINQ